MTSELPTNVSEYTRRVREELSDLPPEQLDSIMDGLEAHLTEVVADGQADLEAALGSPTTYAADLRAAAGIEPRAPLGSTRPHPTWSRRHTAIAVAAGIGTAGLAVAAFAKRPAGVVEILAVVLAIGVAWWVARTVVERGGLIGTQRLVAGAALAFGALCTATVLGAVVADKGSGGSYQPPMVQSSTTTFSPGDYTSTMVQVANCSAQNGVAGMMTSVLSGAGFQLAPPTAGTCDPKLGTSIVIYDEGAPGAQTVAVTLAQLLGGLPYEAAILPIPVVDTGAWADGSGVVLMLGNDLAGKTLDQIWGVSIGTTTTGVPLPTAPGVQGTLLFTVQLEELGGYAEVRDADGQKCLLVSVPPGQSGGCVDVDVVESGSAWSAVQLGTSSLLYGLAPTDRDFHVEVAGHTVLPDSNGFWYTLLPQGASQFTIVIDGQGLPVTVAQVPPFGPTTTTTEMQP